MSLTDPEDTRKQVMRIRKGLRVVVEACRKDSSLAISVTAAARRIGVVRDTLYAHQGDSEVAALLDELRELKRARADRREAERQAQEIEMAERTTAAPAQKSLPPNPRAALLAKDTDAQLAARISGAVAKAQETMRMFIGQRRRDRDVADVTKVAYDLDAAVNQLSGLNGQIGALAAEARRRRRLRAGLSVDVPAGPDAPSLDLGFTPSI